ncbi:MAG: beta-ketoacyl-[acyl-carrier-protein] synthase family protein [Bacteroidales bacterium]|nr:beta-ketoacyl-[acyl-carrier-protein] synthase family protein [Bacteroidales bacterium]
MNPRIVITGFGVISAIGRTKDETLEALKKGRSGIAPVQYLETDLKDFPVGEVKATDAQLKEMASVGKDELVPRTALMGIVALKEAIREAGLSQDDLRRRTTLINGTTVGGMDVSEKCYLDMIAGKGESANAIRVHDCGASTGQIADAVGGVAAMTTPSTACSSAANSMILGANLIRSGQAEIVAAGGSECLSSFHLHGFNSLMILDTKQCRPFDATREGLNLGEGAGFVILETLESAERRGAEPLAELLGYGNACDAFHQTASSPDGEGAFLAMTEALEKGNVKPEEIDYINAHGTGTPNNDASESAALKRVFGDRLPKISSTKSFTGHTTSASGAIEAGFCLLTLRTGFIPGNIGWENEDPSCIIPTAGGQSEGPVRKILCNAFGFGGNDSSLLLGSFEKR